MIVLQNICKAYDKVVVFNSFNLQIKKNSITCVMGQSGKGKTTLIRLLMGLEMPDSGIITGIENAKMSAVFQEDRLCESLDVYANIMLPHLYKKSDAILTREQVNSALACIELEGLASKMVSSLSGGMKRRISILRALLADYDVLFLDEPFKGLDDDTKQTTMQYLLDKTAGKTVIYITHDKAELDFIKPDTLVTL